MSSCRSFRDWLASLISNDMPHSSSYPFFRASIAITTSNNPLTMTAPPAANGERGRVSNTAPSVRPRPSVRPSTFYHCHWARALPNAAAAFSAARASICRFTASSSKFQGTTGVPQGTAIFKKRWIRRIMQFYAKLNISHAFISTNIPQCSFSFPVCVTTKKIGAVRPSVRPSVSDESRSVWYRNAASIRKGLRRERGASS